MYLDLQPSPVYAGDAFRWYVYVSEKDTRPLEGARLELVVTSGPARVGDLFELEAQAVPGTYGGDGSFPRNGTYRLEVRVRSAGGEDTGNATVDVYPDLGARIAPADPSYDVYTNRTTKLRFQTVDAANAVRDAWSDLRLRLEHWSGDHSTRHWTTEENLTPVESGVFELVYDFPQDGMYHLRFASHGGRFGYDDAPILHVGAVDAVPLDSGKRSRDSPSAGVLALAAAVPFALAGLRARR